MNTENKMTNAELEKIHAQIAKLMAETSKINKEAFWYPFVISGGVIGATATVVKLFF